MNDWEINDQTFTVQFDEAKRKNVDITKYLLTASIEFKRVSCSQMLFIICPPLIAHQQVYRPLQQRFG